MKPIIGDQKFIKVLDDWLFKNDQASATWLLRNKMGIPEMFRNHSGFLYRGMFIEPELFQEISEKGIAMKTLSSWTTEEKVARRFATDATASGSKAKGNIRIIIKKKVSVAKQILNIQKLIEFMGTNQMISLGLDDLSADSALKEFEVLCDKGIKITSKDITLI